MPEPLKNMYNHETLSKFALDIQSVYKSLQVDDFINSVMDETWDDLELKDRGRKICITLGEYLPKDCKEAIKILDAAIIAHGEEWGGFFPIVLSDFVEVFGQDETNWDISMAALQLYTQYCSSEFAVRPFIINHEERMMAQMYAWAKHENEHIRRLASEGCRPALPWGQALPKYKKDPTPVLIILEQLKTDPSPYVRKSVANNLNDISKTHPDLVAKLAKDWYGKNSDTDWVVKHGCRTLLKKGNRDVLAIFGFDDADAIEVSDFALEKSSTSIGSDIIFSFAVGVKKDTKLRLEYGIDYMKSNAKTNRKIFQISESAVEKDLNKNYTRKHSFADVSTRKHYPGTHSVTLIVNGAERGTLNFEVEA